jgi:hypothetical protein
VTRVWLPDPPETVEPLKNLPEGIEADVWTGAEPLPDSKDEVEFIVLPPGLRAALDVTEPEPLPDDHPLWRAPGLLLTPHVGGAVTDARVRAYRVVRDQLQRYAAGEPLRNVIGSRGY